MLDMGGQKTQSRLHDLQQAAPSGPLWTGLHPTRRCIVEEGCGSHGPWRGRGSGGDHTNFRGSRICSATQARIVVTVERPPRLFSVLVKQTLSHSVFNLDPHIMQICKSRKGDYDHSLHQLRVEIAHNHPDLIFVSGP